MPSLEELLENKKKVFSFSNNFRLSRRFRHNRPPPPTHATSKSSPIIRVKGWSLKFVLFNFSFALFQMKSLINSNPVKLVFYQHALPLCLCLRPGLLCLGGCYFGTRARRIGLSWVHVLIIVQSILRSIHKSTFIMKCSKIPLIHSEKGPFNVISCRKLPFNLSKE